MGCICLDCNHARYCSLHGPKLRVAISRGTGRATTSRVQPSYYSSGFTVPRTILGSFASLRRYTRGNRTGTRSRERTRIRRKPATFGTRWHWQFWYPMMWLSMPRREPVLLSLIYCYDMRNLQTWHLASMLEVVSAGLVAENLALFAVVDLVTS